MPQRVNAQSDIGTSKVSSDSYDVNNIFLTDQGWVYRHWKGNPATTDRYWDEILVAGQVPAEDENGDPVTGDDPYEVTVYEVEAKDKDGNPILDNGVQVKISTGNQKYSNPLTSGVFEVAAGDGAYDIQYSPSYDGGMKEAAEDEDRYPYPAVVTSSASAPTPANVTLVFTAADGTSSYTSAGGANASVSIEAGGTLTITNNTGGHPVDVRVSDEGATVSTGTLAGAPAGPGESLTWDTTGVTPGTYYYQCTAHAAMVGQIIVT